MNKYNVEFSIFDYQTNIRTIKKVVMESSKKLTSSEIGLSLTNMYVRNFKYLSIQIEKVTDYVEVQKMATPNGYIDTDIAFENFENKEGANNYEKRK